MAKILLWRWRTQQPTSQSWRNFGSVISSYCNLLRSSFVSFGHVAAIQRAYENPAIGSAGDERFDSGTPSEAMAHDTTGKKWRQTCRWILCRSWSSLWAADLSIITEPACPSLQRQTLLQGKWIRSILRRIFIARATIQQPKGRRKNTTLHHERKAKKKHVFP